MGSFLPRLVVEVTKKSGPYSSTRVRSEVLQENADLVWYVHKSVLSQSRQCSQSDNEKVLTWITR